MPIRRAATLFLILALVVGSAAAFVPPAAPAMDPVGSVADGGDCCRPCAPAAMDLADCGAICQSPAAVAQPAVVPARAGHPSPWSWTDESGRGGGVEPATGPPRS